MSSNAHVPVLLGPVLEGLAIKQDGKYVDGTFGRGGHSGAILERLNSEGRLIAIDRDPQAIAAAPTELTNDPRLELVRSDFAELAACLEERGIAGQVDGLLFDLGVSSPQLDEAERGFSFLRDGPLDMRMDPDTGVSAADWLQSVEEATLRRVLFKYGEERDAARIARAVVSARADDRISTTLQLADIVASVVPAHTRKKHPATKTFQAIRIFINDELGQIETALQQSIDVLKKGGRLCVISFHSLEDRLVKRFFKKHSTRRKIPRGLPLRDSEIESGIRLKLTMKAIKAGAGELALNPRSRSAVLRVAERAA